MAFRRSKTAEVRAEPKGAGKRPTTTGRVTPKASGRYTPPIPKEYKVSPRWVPVLMLVLLVLGMLIIVCNYLGIVPRLPVIPGTFAIKKSPDNAWLFVGLALITGGFITATRYR